MLKVAVVLLAALLPLALIMVTGAAGICRRHPVVDQAPAPVSLSAPVTESAVVVPVTGLGVAVTLLAIGGWSVTVTVLLPLIPPLVAVTVPLTELSEAVKSPELLPIVPAVDDQVNVGWVAMAVPN